MHNNGLVRTGNRCTVSILAGMKLVLVGRFKLNLCLPAAQPTCYAASVILLFTKGLQMLEIVCSTAFIEKVVLLFLTALLTGILVPYINAKINDRKLRNQKLFEAELIRQNKLIESQNDLLIQLEKLAHQFHQLIVSVAWYKVGEPNEERYNTNRNEYEKHYWQFETEISTEIAKAHRLVSVQAHKQLVNFHEYLEQIDIQLVKLAKQNKPDEEWKKFLNEEIKINYKNKLRTMIELLAKDCGLHRK